MKIGDFVGFVYAQPGNDVTWLVVTGIDGDKVTGFDPAFEISVTADISRLWIASERELDVTIGHYKFGNTTNRELLSKARERLIIVNQRGVADV